MNDRRQHFVTTALNLPAGIPQNRGEATIRCASLRLALNSSPLTGRRYVEASGKSEAVTRKLVFLFYFTYIYNSRYDTNRNEGAHTVYTYTSRVR